MTSVKLLTELEGSELRGSRCMVTGGCGFVGSYLTQMILAAGAEFVVVLDARKSSLYTNLVHEDSRVKLVLCDVRDKEQVHKCMKGIDIVFHTAAYFGFPVFSSNFFGDHEKVVDINVNGTSSVLQACIENDVKHIIYTSSMNVIFDGITPIINGDEKIPYPLTYLDPYGFAKAKAERDVLSTNGKYGISTCSLRPNGIYGPGEVNNVGRALQTFQSLGGVHFFVGTLGEKKAVSDWTYVENIAHANILAAVALKRDGLKAKISGQCYNITDGEGGYFNNIEFFKDFVLRCGLSYNPRITLPTTLMLPVAKAIELFCYIVRPIRPMQPLLTPLEVLKLTTTHTFSIEKAKADLGYAPLPIAKCREVTADFYVEWMKSTQTNNFPLLFLVGILVMLLVSMILRFVFGN